MYTRKIPPMDKDRLNRLNCMNYQVNTEEGHYYLQDGINSLISFAANHGVNSFVLVTKLMNDGQWVGQDSNGEEISVTMI